MATTSTLYATGATQVTGTWTNPASATGAANATGTTAPTNCATWVNAARSTTATLELSGYNFQSQVRSDAIGLSVAASIPHAETSTANITGLTAQLYSGATAIGAAATVTRITSLTTHTVTFPTAPTWAQLADLRVRITATRANNTTSSTEYIDAAGLAVTYTAPAKVATLTDDFATDSGQWTLITGGTITGGRLVLPTTTTYSGAASVGMFSLVGSSAYAQSVQYGGTASSIAHYYMDAGGNSDVRFQITGGLVWATYKVAGTETWLSSATYTPGMWLRLSEASGVITWDTSTDGTTWTTLSTWTLAGFAVNQVRPTFYSGYDGTGAAPADSLFDNVNVAPPVSATGGVTLGGTATPAARATATGAVTVDGTATATGGGGGGGAAVTGSGLINDGSTGTTAPLSVTIPAAAGVGDAAIVHLHGTFTIPGDTVTAPSGWTLLGGPTDSGAAANNGGLVYGKTLLSGDPGSTVTFTASAARRIAGTILTVSSGDLSGVQFAALPDSSAGVTADLPTVGSVTAGSMVIALYGRRSAVATTITSMTVPGAYTAGPESRTSVASAGNILARAAYVVASSAGTFGGETTATTSPDTTTGVDFLLALPAVAGGGPTSATASGAITLAGTAAALVTATAGGVLTLGGTATGRAPAAAAGAVTLAGTGTARATATATGSVTLTGTATGIQGSSATGSITLGGTATARAASAATGTVTLGGTATARATGTATGSLTLGGTGAPRAAVTASGSLTLAGAGTLSALANAAGSVTLSGLATGIDSGVDTYHPHTYVTATVTTANVTAVLAGTATGTATITPAAGFGSDPFGDSTFGGGTTQPGTAALAPAATGTAALAGTGTSTATLADGTSTAALVPTAAVLAALQTT